MRWHEKIERLRTHRGMNLDERMAIEEQAKRNEVGLLHPSNGAGMVVRDNGNIEWFSDFGLGIQVHKDTRTIALHAEKIKLFCEDFQIVGEGGAMAAQDAAWQEIRRMREEDGA